MFTYYSLWFYNINIEKQGRDNVFTTKETIGLVLVLSLYFAMVVWAFIKNKDKLKEKGFAYEYDEYCKEESEEYDYES